MAGWVVVVPDKHKACVVKIGNIQNKFSAIDSHSAKCKKYVWPPHRVFVFFHPFCVQKKESSLLPRRTRSRWENE